MSPAAAVARPRPHGVGRAGVADLVAAKGTQTIAVCIPARDEEATIAGVVGAVRRLGDAGLVDDIVVVDDGSADATGRRAAAAGARVVGSPCGPGKGQALSAAVASTGAGLLVFLDADVESFSGHFVTGLVAPLLLDPGLHLVKAAYRRPLHGRPGEGGRLTELLARPLLERFFPDLAGLAQPLAGECAVRRSTLDGLVLADGYGVEVGLLIDVRRRFGRGAVAEADLGERVHRNRPLLDLRPHAGAVLDAVLARVSGPGP